ncbi:MAG: hypothetical protein HY921_05030 [Elusimicrobia bacterium]|nr:hypothetical protein [Elusimicrobiota bacterium]
MGRTWAVNFSLLLLLLPAAWVLAQEPPREEASALYELGTLKRREGRPVESKEAFLRLLEITPASAGALEGLALACLSLGQYEEAGRYLEQWDRQSPGNSYILGLLARSYSGQGRYRDLASVYAKIKELEPGNPVAARRLDSAIRERGEGIFPKISAYKSVGTEGLGTSAPLQRIVYEGRFAGMDAMPGRVRSLNLRLGASVRQEAQRNDTAGFTYYDLLEQTYTFGFGARPRGDLALNAEYGQSVFTDQKRNSIGTRLFSRVKLSSELNIGGAGVRMSLKRAPKLLRGSGNSDFFTILREASARVDFDASRRGWDFDGHGEVSEFSEGSVWQSYRLRATKEFGSHIVQPAYSHGVQEFYGAAPGGRLGSVGYDRWSLRYRWREDELGQAGLSYAYDLFHDANRLHEFSADLAYRLKWYKDVSLTYAYGLLDYAAGAEGYRSTDEFTNTFGLEWRRRQARELWTSLAFDKAFYVDVRGHYEVNAYKAGLEWYPGSDLSLRGEGKIMRSTVRDDSYSFALQGRWSF